MKPVGTSDIAMDDTASFVGWNGVWTGAIIGIAFMVLVSSLWLALSFGSQVAVFYNYLTWWIGGTAIAAMALAGFVAGAVNRSRGVIGGLGNAASTWALLVLGALVFGLPGTLFAGTAHTLVTPTGSVTVTTVSFWTVFWSVLIGLGASVVGGVAGGLMPRGKEAVDVRTADATGARIANRRPTDSPLPSR